MKYTLLIIALFCFSLDAFSQIKERAIKTNPLSLVLRSVRFSYEQALSQKNSVQVGVTLINRKIDGYDISGFGLIPEFRFYSRQALDKFYFAPLLNYTALTIIDFGEKTKGNAFGGGAKIGWNWLLGSKNHFVIDFGLGFQYLSFNGESGSPLKVLDGINGMIPIVNLSLGYAF